MLLALSLVSVPSPAASPQPQLTSLTPRLARPPAPPPRHPHPFDAPTRISISSTTRPASQLIQSPVPSATARQLHATRTRPSCPVSTFHLHNAREAAVCHPRPRRCCAPLRFALDNLLHIIGQLLQCRVALLLFVLTLPPRQEVSPENAEGGSASGFLLCFHLLHLPGHLLQLRTRLDRLCWLA